MTANHPWQGLSRRAFLRQAAVLASLPVGAVLLAACGGSSATATATAAPSAAPSAASAAPSAAAAASATPTTARAATPATSGSPATGATPAGATGDATPRIVAAANAFLTTLNTTQKASVLFDWSNTAQKQRWSNLPEGGFTRAGLMWANLSDAQRTAWLAIMQATLSTEGYNRVIAEWNADDALAASEGSGGAGTGGTPGTGGAGGGTPGAGGFPGGGTPRAGGPGGGTPGAGGFPGGGTPGAGGAGGGGQLLYGKQYYYLALIGAPSATTPWQWQWGGHHVTINATISGTNVALTPSFIGVQPGSYTANGQTIRPLGDIEDEAFALVGSLDATQQKAAVLGNTFIDLVLGPGQDGKSLQSEGLPAAQLNATQQAAFLKLIGHYTGLVNDEDAAARNAEVKANLAQTYFAWYGPTAKGSSSYFRVTGPTIVIEYSPQSMGGNAALHVHGIYRDPTNDYGAKIAR